MAAPIKIITHDVVRELNEVRNQLSYSKRIGFFFGAGTSMAIGISGIQKLTNDISNSFKEEEKKKYLKVQEEIKTDDDIDITIEDALNYIRLIRQVTNNRPDKKYGGLNGIDAQKMDFEICNKIYEIISNDELKADLMPAKKFFSWYNWLPRDFTKEIFTTNYDLILEK